MVRILWFLPNVVASSTDSPFIYRRLAEFNKNLTGNY